jgi:hypothetical protein
LLEILIFSCPAVSVAGTERQKVAVCGTLGFGPAADGDFRVPPVITPTLALQFSACWNLKCGTGDRRIPAMETSKLVGLFLGAFTWGILRELIAGYRAWKRRRSLIAPDIRDAGWLITDRNLWIFEKALLSVLMACFLWVFVVCAWFIAGMNGWIDVRRWPTPF